MRYKWIGVIVAACLSVGMSVLAYGSVKDDLAALEKEAGIDADEGASISSRLSALEKELDISADENSSTSDRIKALVWNLLMRRKRKNYLNRNKPSWLHTRR